MGGKLGPLEAIRQGSDRSVQNFLLPVYYLKDDSRGNTRALILQSLGIHDERLILRSSALPVGDRDLPPDWYALIDAMHTATRVPQYGIQDAIVETRRMLSDEGIIRYANNDGVPYDPKRVCLGFSRQLEASQDDFDRITITEHPHQPGVVYVDRSSIHLGEKHWWMHYSIHSPIVNSCTEGHEPSVKVAVRIRDMIREMGIFD
jgi:hypothetical protein